MRLSGSMHFCFGNRFPGFIVGNDFHRSRLIACIHPHQTVTLLTFKLEYRSRIGTVMYRNAKVFRTPSLTLPINEEFGWRIVGIHEHRSDLSFASFPIPVGQNMQSLLLLIPMAAIEKIPVFRQSCQIDYTKQRRMAGPIGIVWSRFSQIIESGPYEFADAIR